ncbi:hypothetical protein [Sandaracinus amylolyticus]|uniref:hypothetical protein n=1 Tax=Sandaracinus amylolyticus TaxID=927083 RepID=UPI001F473027|nr:hypothetical protein [Sandaracinus amylolyticus]UJR84376.1 Hypothetical protein I5071_64550 [Sandaracinus amylolyticus]
MSRAARALPRITDEDRFFDYCLQPYDPLRDPRGKLRSEALLANSLDVAGAPPSLDAALAAIQRTAGRDATVFGVKHQHGRLWWELYFYDQLAPDTRARVPAIADAIAPWIRLDLRPPPSAPHFMFSFDLHPRSAEGSTVHVLNLYLRYHEVQGGRSYKLSAAGAELDNVYRFLHPKTEIREVLHEIRQSVLVDHARVPLSRVLWPELVDCNRVCVAKKRFADAVYYSGIDVGQLLFFLRAMEYPAEIVEFVERHRGELDHLRFDVGVDYTMLPDGSLVMTKSSYYGTL